MLTAARLAVAGLPLRIWRGSLGYSGPAPTEAEFATAQRLCLHVDRAAGRLPFTSKCLPRAIALSWSLRRKSIGHVVVIAVRPASARSGDDDLHAWVETDGRRLIGELPGPWIEVLRQGGP